MRLKRFRVDELKRRMGTLDAMRADLDRKLADLEGNVERERQRANDSDIGRLAFPSFLRSIESRRENLRNTLKEIDREREQCQGELSAAYQDLKSLELATEQQAKRVAEIEARRRSQSTSAQDFLPLTPQPTLDLLASSGPGGLATTGFTTGRSVGTRLGPCRRTSNGRCKPLARTRPISRGRGHISRHSQARSAISVPLVPAQSTS